MNDGPGLNLVELRRQLTDLAHSAEAEQPWDDPLPHVLRAASAADLEARPQPGPRPFTVLRGRVAKISWPRLNPIPIVSVAAAFLVVALVGVLLHGGGSDSKKSTAGSHGTVAAAAGTRAKSGPAPGTVVPDATQIPYDTRVPYATSCLTLPASSRIALSAPSEAVQGGVIRVRVTTSGGLRLTSPTVLVRAGSKVVGRLVQTVVNPGPTPTGPASSFTVTGRLVRTSGACDLPGNTPPGPVRPPAGPLAAGRYELVVTGSTSAGNVASAAVAIIIHR